MAVSRSPATIAREARFRRLAMTDGGLTKALSDPGLIEAANVRVEGLRGVAAEDLALRLQLLDRNMGQSPRVIYALTHDIRGIAGGFGYTGLGALAAILCKYIDTLRQEADANRALMEMLASAMRQAFASPGDPAIDAIVEGATKAVAKTLARSGIDAVEFGRN